MIIIMNNAFEIALVLILYIISVYSLVGRALASGTLGSKIKQLP